jgi:hypothetical protein
MGFKKRDRAVVHYTYSHNPFKLTINKTSKESAPLILLVPFTTTSLIKIRLIAGFGSISIAHLDCLRAELPRPRRV